MRLLESSISFQSPRTHTSSATQPSSRLTPNEYLLLLAGTTLPSLLVAWAVGFLVRRFAPRWGLLDHPSAAVAGDATENYSENPNVERIADAPEGFRIGSKDNCHKAHHQATPLGGGLAITLAVLAPFAIGQLLLMRINAGEGLFGWDVPEMVTVHAAGLAS